MNDNARMVMGWDIGGVNIKVCRVPVGGDEDLIQSLSRGFEIWKKPQALAGLLREMADALGPVESMAVTMTAELSDAFESKRQGVTFILKALSQAFPGIDIRLLGIDGVMVPLADALGRPLDFAANNWLASALYVATRHPHCFLMDMGSTTTDIIPIVHGRLDAQGRDDTSRLAAGELVYTGALRTNPNTLVRSAPFMGRMVPVADEYFCIMADVHNLLGHITEQDYSCPTPDGRGKAVEDSHARLARLICADQEAMSLGQARFLAGYIHERQMEVISRAWHQAASRVERPHEMPWFVVGQGGFLLKDLAGRLGIKVLNPAGTDVEALPARAAALLLAAELRG